MFLKEYTAPLIQFSGAALLGVLLAACSGDSKTNHINSDEHTDAKSDIYSHTFGDDFNTLSEQIDNSRSLNADDLDANLQAFLLSVASSVDALDAWVNDKNLEEYTSESGITVNILGASENALFTVSQNIDVEMFGNDGSKKTIAVNAELSVLGQYQTSQNDEELSTNNTHSLSDLSFIIQKADYSNNTINLDVKSGIITGKRPFTAKYYEEFFIKNNRSLDVNDDVISAMGFEISLNADLLFEDVTFSGGIELKIDSLSNTFDDYQEIKYVSDITEGLWLNYNVNSQSKTYLAAGISLDLDGDFSNAKGARYAASEFCCQQYQ